MVWQLGAVVWCVVAVVVGPLALGPATFCAAMGLLALVRSR